MPDLPNDDAYSELAQLTGRLIHDIKNHVSTLGLNLQLLAEDLNEPETPRERRSHQRVLKLQHETNRLAELSNDFLRFIQQKELSKSPSKINDIIDDLVDFYGPSARQANVEIKTFLPGDLPTIDPLSVRRCLAGLTNDTVDIATIAAQIIDDADVANPNIVKAIAPLEGDREVAYARDFVRRVDASMLAPYWHHIGVYAYRRESLERFVGLPVSLREKERSLEQMRALDNNMKIAVVKVDGVPLGVDTPADLEIARRLLRT